MEEKLQESRIEEYNPREKVLYTYNHDLVEEDFCYLPLELFYHSWNQTRGFFIYLSSLPALFIIGVLNQFYLGILVFIILIVFFKFKTERTKVKMQPLPKGDPTYTTIQFHKNYFNVTRKYSISYKYEYIQKAVETNSHFFALPDSGMQVVVISKQDCDPELLAFLREKFGNKWIQVMEPESKKKKIC